MLIGSDTLSGIFKGFKVLFKQFFDTKASFWEKLAMKVPSNSSSETYAWFLNIPQMREWIGDREIKNLSADGYTIRNKPFENTIAVPRDDIEDDALGIYRPQIAMLAEEAKTFPDTLIAGLLKDGTKNKCYDKENFFSGSHKVGSGGGAKNVSNLGSYKLTPESYGAARSAMMSLTNNENKPLKITPNLLVVAPALEGVGRKILLSQQIDGSDNIYYNSAELLVLPELAGMDTAWFLLDVSKPIKPFIVQERRPVDFTAVENPNDETVFMKNQYMYGASWRGNVGYTLWQMAYMSTGTVPFQS